MLAEYDDHGVRFRYPAGWELEADDDGEGLVSLSLASTEGGTAFLLIRLDEDRPEPSDLMAESFQALRAEYPELEAEAASERIAGHDAQGMDFDFLSLDVANSAEVRCVRTPGRTIYIFAQWSDLDGERPEGLVHALRRSFEETDPPSVSED